MMPQALILAGGKGSRLQSVVNDLPKPMAPVAGYPFIHWILLQCQSEGIQKVTLSVGYMYESIISYFGNQYLDIEIQYVIENQPLGTGGAIKNSINHLNEPAKSLLILNGDTYNDFQLNRMQNLFNKENADLVILLKKMQNFDRYGTVQIDANHRILAFTEKKFQEEAWINSGVYLLNTEHFLLHAPQKENFSFETEFLETHTTNLKFYASLQKGYFIDIGIPEDYLKSQEDFSYLAPE